MQDEMQKRNFFDYYKKTVNEDKQSQYMDGYECFGWQLDEHMAIEKSMGKATLYWKRSRQILNKTELIRLQRHYEACMEEIDALEASCRSVPSMVVFVCGLFGCAFLAGSVFAVTAEPPIVWLCALLGVFGFAAWGAAYFGYQIARRYRTKKVAPLIEDKYEEACAVCEQARKLL